MFVPSSRIVFSLVLTSAFLLATACTALAWQDEDAIYIPWLVAETNATSTPVVQPFTVLSARAISPTSVEVVLSDAVGSSGAVAANYSINALNISAADTNSDTVTLTTSPQSNVNYTVTVSNVRSQTGQALDANGRTTTFQGKAMDPADATGTNSYLKSLNKWEDVAPIKDEQNGEPVGEASEPEEKLVDEQLYTCTTQQYSLTKNPKEIVLADPNAGIIWPGALLKGSSHLDGGGLQLLALDKSRRAPMGISIDGGVARGIEEGVSTVIDQPVQSTVKSGINELIRNVLQSDVAVGAGYSHFEKTVSYSEEQVSLEVGFSARYLAGSLNNLFNYDRKANERTYTATFIQRLYTISIDQPEEGNPGSFFSDSVTAEDLEGFGISNSNLPIYISDVSYGRILMYSVTSSASDTEIKNALDFSYTGGASIDVDLEAKYKKILQEGKIEVVAVGGPNVGVSNLIINGELQSYFEEPIEISQLEPVSFIIRNLGDNSLARVSNTFEYPVETCEAIPATPGAFEFAPRQKIEEVPVAAPYESLVAFINDDNRADLVINHKSNGKNQIWIGFGQTDGTFDFQEMLEHPGGEGFDNNWSGYDTYIADINGDSHDDIVWNVLRFSSDNIGLHRTHVALSNGDGSFEFLPHQDRPETGNWASPRTVFVGDVNGDLRDDLVWNYKHHPSHGGNFNHIYIALGQSDGSLDLLPLQSHSANENWAGFEFAIGDMDGNGQQDLIWTRKITGLANRIYIAKFVPSNNTVNFGSSHWNSSGCTSGCGDWTLFKLFVGNFDDEAGDELIFTSHLDNIAVWSMTSNGDGTFNHAYLDTGQKWEEHPVNPPQLVDNTLATWQEYQRLSGDFNGDGRQDLLWNNLGTANHSYVALAKPTSQFEYAILDQTHPAESVWSSYKVLIADVIGNNRDDVIWIHDAFPLQIYIGVAKTQ